MKSLGICRMGAEGGRNEGGQLRRRVTAIPRALQFLSAAQHHHHQAPGPSRLSMVTFFSANSLVAGRPLSQGYQGLCA